MEQNRVLDIQSKFILAWPISKEHTLLGTSYMYMRVHLSLTNQQGAYGIKMVRFSNTDY